ncbi:hypothetical protein N7466_001350 [Penicillium verhagenii]|uniref:uncharacterized protein n=1 Tax=Penicillium verhagenii TaxID=1562060 RepID=UPI0025458981|nr:uncharacterized protein N7466_001350 [Penicillium verhagenii]KAJ5948335.1 hypothetical protein N7466_001350 [Penicillium verhagenii]
MAVDSDDRTGDHEAHPLLSEIPVNVPIGNGAKKLLVLTVCSLICLAADFGMYLSLAPQTAIFEQIICRNYSEFQGVGNNVTRGEDPWELALILGYKSGFEVLPTIFLSLGYGFLSDHWGRKPVLYLAALGITLSELWTRIVCAWPGIFPLRSVWLSSVWLLIGGGDQTMSFVAINMVADVVSEEERSNALFRLSSFVVLSEVLAGPASAYLMRIDLWTPYILGFAIATAGLTLIVFLPETLEDAKAKRVIQGTASGISAEFTLQPGKQFTVQALRHGVHEFKESIHFMWTDSNISWIIAVGFVSMMSRESTNILLQYTSKKFNWSIAQAGLLISIRGMVGIFCFSILMPGVTFLAVRYFDLHGKFRDYRLSQLMGLFGVIGFTVVGFAPTAGILITGLVIVSSSAAFMVTTRSLATSLVLPDHVGTLYSALAISQSIGTFVAGPLFAYLFRLGMHLGSAWMGLPFLQAAVCFGFATAALWRIRLNRSLQSDEEGGAEESLVS